MIELIPRLPLYEAFYLTGHPKLLPLSVVCSVSYRCNSKCKTCDVWRKPNDDFTLDEWDQTFQKLGASPVYMTFTGGEPFMRKDLADIVTSAARHCRPSFVTIPTNGILEKSILRQVKQILADAPEIKLGVNLSLDGIDEQHDEIRGVPGNWEKARRTWAALKTIDNPRLTLSIHTVVSKYNVHDVPRVFDELQTWAPDSYISEVAEERVELDTVGWNITPSATEYGQVADFLSEKARESGDTKAARLTQAFRAHYYQMAKQILEEQRQVIPCHAGWASGHIAPNGDVWTCCIRAEAVGNLRETNYDLAPIWRGAQLKKMRKSIKAGECACPMANASYTNMMLHVPTVAKVVPQWLRNERAGRGRSHRAMVSSVPDSPGAG